MKIRIIPEFRDFSLEILKDEVQDRVLIDDNLNSSIKANQRNLDNLIEMRINKLLTDAEFLDRKKDLSIELEDLKAKRSQTESRAQNWREVAEQVFNFALYSVENFENGDFKNKKEILLSLGQNLQLKDQDLSLGFNKWIEPLEKEQANMEREFKRLEPSKNRSPKGENGLTVLNVPSWYRRRDSNPRHPVPKTGALSS